MKKLFWTLILSVLLATNAYANADHISKLQRYVETGESVGLAIRHIGIMEFKHNDADGNVIWHGVGFNNLADDGEQMFLDCALRATNCPTTFYLRLADSTSTCSIVDTSTVANIVAMGQPSTNGYAHQEITRNTSGWVTLALDGGDYQATSSTETFSASGGSWGPVHCAWISNSDADSGTYPTAYPIAYIALSQGRTLASGESLNVTYRVKLQ